MANKMYIISIGGIIIIIVIIIIIIRNIATDRWNIKYMNFHFGLCRKRGGGHLIGEGVLAN